MIDVCDKVVGPVVDNVGKPIEERLLIVVNEFNKNVVDKMNVNSDLLTKTINDIVQSIEKGMNSFTFELNDLSNDIKDLLILINSAGAGSIFAIIKILILPYILRIFKGISIKNAIRIATIIILIPIIGSLYMSLKFINPM